MKKGAIKTADEIWYGYTLNMNYFKIFGIRCNIMKDARNEKIISKGDDSIFLGYSTRSKAYNFLNKAINRMVENENVRIDEFVEKE